MSLSQPTKTQRGSRATVRLLLAPFLLAPFLLACDSPATTAAPSATAGPATAAAPTAAPLRPGSAAGAPAEAPSAPVAHVPETVDDEPVDEHEAACAPADAGLEPMQLLRFVWTSGLEGKDPKDKLLVGRPGGRVYAHLTIRNRSGRERCLQLRFEVEGKKRSEVTLKIGKSWSWRTWAYNTMRADDHTPLRLLIEDDQGTVVLDKTLPIIPE